MAGHGGSRSIVIGYCLAVGIDCVGWLSFGVRWDGRRDIIFESALDLVLDVGCYCECYCGLLGLRGTWWI